MIAPSSINLSYCFTMRMSSSIMIVPLLLAAFLSVAGAEEVCCKGLPRCFTDGSPYDHLPLPDCQETVQATFSLYTRLNQDSGVTIQPDIPLPFVYDGSKRTAFIIHGWNSDSTKDWVGDISNGLLAKEDMNVIKVDWREGAWYVWYPQSASNVRTTGAIVGTVAQKLIEEGGSAASRLWCIGASLGAHTCGQAGSYVTFKRITGLDPAGPLFESYDLSTGLNPRAADYVEALHSAGRGGLIGFNPGTLKPLGHVDFYPNGGEVQPGCDNYYQDAEQGEVSPKWDLLNADRTPYLACSHNRATQYFIESLRSTGCRFFAREQCDYSDDIPASCYSCGDTPCNELGYSSDRPSGHQGKGGLLYLQTNAQSPYCQG